MNSSSTLFLVSYKLITFIPKCSTQIPKIVDSTLVSSSMLLLKFKTNIDYNKEQADLDGRRQKKIST
jgi:hypothetical protein